MSDTKNEPRPMCKLTVKDFSVIKEAKLEFGKFTVLIGPQSSGKSLLCKLAYFLGSEVIQIAVNHLTNQFDYPTFESSIKKEFLNRFPLGGWGNDEFDITFSSGSYEITASSPTSPPGSRVLSLDLSGEFKEAYIQRLSANITAKYSPQINATGALIDSLGFLSLRWLCGRGHFDSSVYIPLERSYFLDTRRGYRTLASDIDPVLASFATLFADSLTNQVHRQRTQKFLLGNVKSDPEGWTFAFDDGRRLPLSDLSAGSKEILPILSILDFYETRLRAPDWDPGSLAGRVDQTTYQFDEFIIEEPEASVFPATQYELVKEFSELANGSDFRPYFTITTHSPYVLSSFNNLIEAGQAARNNPALQSRIAEIIPREYWIKEGDFKAYSIRDRKLESILNESGFVESNYLDQVSETINDEFDRLIRLEYDHAKAS